MILRGAKTFSLCFTVAVSILFYCGAFSRASAEPYMKPLLQLCVGAIDIVAALSSASGSDRVEVLDTLLSLIKPRNTNGKHTDAWISAATSGAMGSKEVGLLPVLVSVIFIDDGEARLRALAILKIFSTDLKNTKYLISREIDLFPTLVSVVSTNDYGNDASMTAY